MLNGLDALLPKPWMDEIEIAWLIYICHEPALRRSYTLFRWKRENTYFRKGTNLVINLTLPDSQFGQSVKGGVWVWVNGISIYMFIATIKAP